MVAPLAVKVVVPPVQILGLVGVTDKLKLGEMLTTMEAVDVPQAVVAVTEIVPAVVA